jgi:hypothetical protein
VGGAALLLIQLLMSMGWISTPPSEDVDVVWKTTGRLQISCCYSYFAFPSDPLPARQALTNICCYYYPER